MARCFWVFGCMRILSFNRQLESASLAYLFNICMHSAQSTSYLTKRKLHHQVFSLQRWFSLVILRELVRQIGNFNIVLIERTFISFAMFREMISGWVGCLVELWDALTLMRDVARLKRVWKAFIIVFFLLIYVLKRWIICSQSKVQRFWQCLRISNNIGSQRCQTAFRVTLRFEIWIMHGVYTGLG